MPAHDFIIIGLGTVGSATCMTLARRGYSVLGIDKYRPPHKKGSHHGESRSVRRAYAEGSSYVPMALRAWELWRKLEKDVKQKLLVKTGNLTIGPAECPAIKGFFASAQKYGIPYDSLTAADIQKRWPKLTPPAAFVAGLEKEAGIVFPELCIAAFIKEAEQAGAHMVFDEEAVRWHEDSSAAYVHTSRKSYDAGRLLISAGAWSRRLIGIEDRSLMPKRVPVHWVQTPDARDFLLGNFPVNFWQIPAEIKGAGQPTYREFYTLPAIGPAQQLKAAFHNGLADCDPAALDRQVSLEEVKKIRSVLQQYLPSLHRCRIASQVCMYTMTSDGNFYLGKRAGSKHVFGAALAGHGFKFAPVLGEILADLMADTPAAVDVDIFSPQRLVS